MVMKAAAEPADQGQIYRTGAFLLRPDEMTGWTSGSADRQVQ